MSGKPILFSSSMVRAILDGRKTQTRRIVRDDWKPGIDRHWMYVDHRRCWQYSPYGAPGDRLWVRETHIFNSAGVVYRADDTQKRYSDLPPASVEIKGNGWRPSIFMPRWASRIDLEITAVRVERLQSISADDVVSEGISPSEVPGIGSDGSLIMAFRKLWDSINGKRAPWASNPWAWVVEFQRVRP